MPLAAAQLVLVTAAESQALVGAEGWGEVLPLAASGPGEPLGTAAALLGVMSMWRAFYVVYIYSWSQGDFAVRHAHVTTSTLMQRLLRRWPANRNIFLLQAS
jgi:hypothetical protein